MIPRHQPPVHSPLTPRALAAGAAAAVGGAAGRMARVVDRLERQYGSRTLVLTDSGTSALAVALRVAWRAGGRRPAAIPAYSCYDVATAVLAAGVPVLLYDLDPDSLSPDPDSLERAVHRGAGTLVVAHLWGIPLDLERIGAIADAGGCIVIEDAAQGCGVEVDGRPAGAAGALGVLSFGRGKGRTGGAGGALLVNDPSLAAAPEGDALEPGGAGLRPLVASAAQWLLARPELYGLPAALPALRLGETVLNAPWEPRGMPRSAAGVLAAAWDLVPEEQRIRRENAERLLRRLAEGGRLRPVRPPPGRPGYLRLPVTASGRGESRPSPVPRLGVLPGYPRPLGELPMLAPRRLDRGEDFPGARYLAERLLTLPTHSRLRNRDLAALDAWIEEENRFGGTPGAPRPSLPAAASAAPA